MGTCVALTIRGRSVSLALMIVLLAGCGSEKPQASPLMQAVSAVAKSAVSRRSAKTAGGSDSAGQAAVTRADLEKLGTPILQIVVGARSIATLVTPSDVKGDVVTWASQDGMTFTFRGGILIQTRGLGPDLMSAEAPSVAQLLTEGGSHKRTYYFLGPDDQPTRRSYDCTATLTGVEKIEVLERSYTVKHVTETCTRPQGSLTNEYWIDGTIVRQSHELLSGGAGFIDVARVID